MINGRVDGLSEMLVSVLCIKYKLLRIAQQFVKRVCHMAFG